MCLYFYLEQVHLDGITGPVQFDEYGKRKEIDLEVLNLRNNFFERVSSKEVMLLKGKLNIVCKYCT